MGGNWQLAKEKLRGWVSQVSTTKVDNCQFQFWIWVFLNFVVEKKKKRRLKDDTYI